LLALKYRGGLPNRGNLELARDREARRQLVRPLCSTFSNPLKYKSYKEGPYSFPGPEESLEEYLRIFGDGSLALYSNILDKIIGK
jgi:hypothetical protein